VHFIFLCEEGGTASEIVVGKGVVNLCALPL
jgi:hypothetical protein